MYILNQLVAVLHFPHGKLCVILPIIPDNVVGERYFLLARCISLWSVCVGVSCRWRA